MIVFALFLTTVPVTAAAATPTPTSSSTPTPTPTAPRKVLLLDFEALGVAGDEAKVATQIVANVAGDHPGIELLSTADVRRIASLDAERSAAGCDDGGCLADIAGALGADVVLFGSLGRLGSTTTVSLSLYTAADARIQRTSAEVSDVSALPAALRKTTTALLESAFVGGVGGVVDPVESGAFDVPILPIGLLTTGSLAVLGGGVVAALAERNIQDRTVAGSQKRDDQRNGQIALVVVGAGAVVAVAGVVLWWME